MNSEAGNVTGTQQPIAARLTAHTVDEVVTLVREARRTGVPIYPVSTGFNWGYGSASPPVAGCDLLDLSGMNRILNAERISPRNPVAVIEPGVTQGQLHEFLQQHCPELTFNVTGSARDTSIIGNALDRGFGYFGPRKDDLFGLEVVLGSAEVLRTGFRRLGEGSPLAHSHPAGLGPMLDGLFFQGNFGVVTSACFRLRLRRPREVAILLALRQVEDLPAFIDELARMKREGLLPSVSHIGNRARQKSTLGYGVAKYLVDACGLSAEAALSETERALHILAPDEWTSLAALTGNSRQVRAAIHEIRSRTRRIARLTVVTDRLLDIGHGIAHRLRFIPYARMYAAVLSASRPLHGMALGVPTDVAVQNLLWKFGHANERAVELDQSRCGLLYVSPAVPLDGRLAAEVVAGMEAVAAGRGHTLHTTLNIETDTSLVAVANLLFDRAVPGEVASAHACADALLDFVHSQGLEIYRARADMMESIVAAAPDYWRHVRDLKKALDPDNVIAPGRYNLAP